MILTFPWVKQNHIVYNNNNNNNLYLIITSPVWISWCSLINDIRLSIELQQVPFLNILKSTLSVDKTINVRYTPLYWKKKKLIIILFSMNSKSKSTEMLLFCNEELNINIFYYDNNLIQNWGLNKILNCDFDFSLSKTKLYCIQ